MARERGMSLLREILEREGDKRSFFHRQGKKGLYLIH
jgi:hypothetical protein